MEFCVGDRVSLVVDHPDGKVSLHIGDTGTVVKISRKNRGILLGVEWDEYIGGHDIDGRHSCKPGHGWNVFVEEVCLCENENEDYDMAAFSDEELVDLLS